MIIDVCFLQHRFDLFDDRGRKQLFHPSHEHAILYSLVVEIEGSNRAIGIVSALRNVVREPALEEIDEVTNIQKPHKHGRREDEMVGVPNRHGPRTDLKEEKAPALSSMPTMKPPRRSCSGMQPIGRVELPVVRNVFASAASLAKGDSSDHHDESVETELPAVVIEHSRSGDGGGHSLVPVDIFPMTIETIVDVLKSKKRIVLSCPTDILSIVHKAKKHGQVTVVCEKDACAHPPLASYQFPKNSVIHHIQSTHTRS